MSTNSNFTITVQLITLITHHAHPISSSIITGSVNTNPATLRKFVGKLEDADLVRTIPGSTGGTALARSPEEFTLKQINELFWAEILFGVYSGIPNPVSMVGRTPQFEILEILHNADACSELFSRRSRWISTRPL